MAKDDEDKKYKAAVLWHGMWIDGPMVGVAEYDSSRVIFSRNKEGKYDLRNFKDDGYKKAERHHFAYRATCGGQRDHNPKLFSPRIFDETTARGITTKVFDYVGNGSDKIITTLEAKDFEWFHPPKKHTPKNFTPVDRKFNPGEITGDNIRDISDDSGSDSDEE